MRIAILNYADVANFGDVLFPFIVDHELRARLNDAEIAFFSPSSYRLGEFRSQRYDRAELANYDAILMCGGEIVHREDDILCGIYARLGIDRAEHIERPTDLVFDWTDLRVPFKAWIGVGMPPPSLRVAQDVARAGSNLDLIVGRGEGTRARLLASGVPPQRVETSPDLGWLIPRVTLDHDPQASSFRRPYCVVHALPQLEFPGSLDSAVAGLKSVQDRLGIDVICLPLTTCWSDQETLSQLADRADGAFKILDHRLDVFSKAAVLKSCVFYVGQSLHGLIGALAAGRPGGLSYPDLDDKFREFLASLGRSDWRIDDWRGLSALVDRLTTAPLAEILARRARAVAEVDAMFDRLADLLRSATEPSWTPGQPVHIRASLTSTGSSPRLQRAIADVH